MQKSKVSLDIDLAKDGKQSGFARLPHSVHRSANGWIPIPIVSIKNGPGKTMLLMAGVHGDEYEGQVALSNLARQLTADDIEGQLIILPMANYPAAKAGNRVSPIDGGNLARSFPGDPLGSVTQAIAHFIETEMMAQADLVFDLHSGGSSLHYLPSTTALSVPGTESHAKLQAYMETFSAPYALNFHGMAGIGTSSDAASRNNILRIGCEMGGRGWLNQEFREICETGVKKILAQEGVLKNWRQTPSPATQFLTVTKDCYAYAMSDGIFEANAALGDFVTAGSLAGLMHFPSRPLLEPEPVRFCTDGIVVCERPISHCETGDCLFHLAIPT
jgi:predicted deacylase